MPSTGQPLHPTRAHCGLPSTCAVCGQWPAEPLCHDCIDRFAPAPRTAPLVPGPLSTCVAAVAYGYPWSGLLARLKFHDEPGWAGPLAMLMAQAGRHGGLLAACDALVPVPLSHRRLAERGYNQAWELVKALQRRGNPGAPAMADALVRLVETRDQHSLTREERLRNLQGVFSPHPLRVAQLQGMHVLLVDDVSTTGATLQAAAQALVQAGAARVSALVFARTPPR